MTGTYTERKNCWE